MYVIIKHVKTQDDRTLPVIMLDTQSEVWEFDNRDKAQEMVNILNTNTDSGHNRRRVSAVQFDAAVFLACLRFCDALDDINTAGHVADQVVIGGSSKRDTCSNRATVTASCWHESRQRELDALVIHGDSRVITGDVFDHLFILLVSLRTAICICKDY